MLARWRRPMGRLFYWVLAVMMAPGAARAQGPATTTINDTVYRADGTPASGTLLISWPTFSTSGGQTVAAGSKSATLGSGGALSVNLVPNAGATPAGAVYTVVYQLDSAVKTEYWLVGSTSPTTIAAVRTTLGSVSSAGQLASQQYVNSAVSSKANDTAVVHLSGSETVTGLKQFSVAPTAPTPTTSTAVANKAYVDAAVASSGGGGSFVSKAGDSMTGALTLAGDPTAPNQASTRHYVDTGLAAKADVVAGTVPSSELGSGTANSGTCLLGNGTWGPCGTSSNAVQIQSVPVDTASPSDNQVLTYVASLGKYQPRAGGGVSAGMQAVKYATDFSWTASTSTDLTTAGAKTVSLTACPPGVTGSEPYYYVYISGTGTAEAVLVTGGTCAGNGAAGTLQFTTVNSHSTGYTIKSASGGLQESLIAARFSTVNPADASQGGKVIVPPGELNLYARVSVRSSNIAVDFSSAIVDCWMTDTCIFAGDPTDASAYQNITLITPRGRPMVVNGTSPFIETNGQRTTITNLTTRFGLAGGTFGTYVRVDNDQAFLLDGLNATPGFGLRCDATYCGAAVLAPGPFGVNAAVGWLKNLNIAMQCQGNGVDWESGNSVRISDSVIEGFAQYGVKSGVLNSGFHGTEMDNVYMEVGNCSNPQGNIGQMGALSRGAPITVRGALSGMQVVGQLPVFASSGPTPYLYYLVIHDTTSGTVSAPYVFGTANTNGSGSLSLSWPKVTQGTDTITYDVLRTVASAGAAYVAPFGSGAYSVTTNVAQCSGAVCTATDTQAALGSYTVANQTFAPDFSFWPGGIILTKGATAYLDWYQSALANGSQVVSTDGMNHPTVFAQKCFAATLNGAPLYVSCLATDSSGNSFGQLSSTILGFGIDNTNGGAAESGLKGRLIFEKNARATAGGATHIVTLLDSNPAKTAAYGNNRPPNDANDTYIGLDNTSQFTPNLGQARLAFGAPVSISNYIGNAGDGTNWLERLSAGLKEFKTSVQMDSGLTVAGQIQADSLVWTGTGAWSVLAGFGTMTAASSGKSKIGFGASGKLQVSENGGSVFEVAKLDSGGNVSENANTATALAATPTQCNGSFATGIQANGNANCGTADVVQLAESAPPTGIANFGLFWFDTTCHCPKVISNNGQPVQLGLTNVFNSDANGTNVANVIEERNSTNPQELRLYGTYTDNSNYERARIAFDSTDGYYFLGADAAGSGSQRGLGFWMQGSLRWVMDTGFNLKPWSDNNRDFGSAALRPKRVYVGTYLDLTGGSVATDVTNASSTGTTVNKLAKLTGAPATVVAAGTSDTSGVIGVVVDGAGTSGSAQLARTGQASCVFDGGTTAGDYVQISSTTAGDCHDAGASYPTSGQVLGRVLSTNASAGTYAMLIGGEAQGGAPINSPAFTGTPTVPTAAANTNTTQAASTAYVVGQMTPNTTANPWMPVMHLSTSATVFSSSANKAGLFGVILPAPKTTTNVTYDVGTADNTSATYDLGIYSGTSGGTCTLVAHTGAIAGSTSMNPTGWHTVNWTGGSVTLAPGRYYLAITSSSTSSTAVLAGDSAGLTFAGGAGAGSVGNVSVTSGGTLPATATCPTDSYGLAVIPGFAVN